MIILAIKTDQPESQFTLFDDHKELISIKYLAHQDLAQTIHIKISELLNSQKMDWQDVEGIIGFMGPGSFTGLRIGLSVANSLAYGLGVAIIGAKDPNWQSKAIDKLLAGQNDKRIIPFYGAEPHVTQAKK